MTAWSDHRMQDLLEIECPIIQAPMAGAGLSKLAIAVSEAGGLGSLGCATLSPEDLLREVKAMREHTLRPINLNFFCHQAPPPAPAREAYWQELLAPYYRELGLDPQAPLPSATRAPFDEAACALVEEFQPEIVSFHFGLPKDALLNRVKATGAKILSSATTVDEALWLEAKGCDAIIAQGSEAGGHRGIFLRDDLSTQMGTMCLVPLVVDAVSVPVIAAGGIADARGIVAALALGASAVQLGTAYLLCPESTISPLHRAALQRPHETALTNLFTGRPARGIVNRLMRELSPIRAEAPAFPRAAAHIAALRAQAEAGGSTDFTPLWSGQSANLARKLPAGRLTKTLAAEVADLKI